MSRIAALVVLGIVLFGSAASAQQTFECVRKVRGQTFTLDCERMRSGPVGQFDIGIQDLRRYTALGEPAQWLEFNVRGYKNLSGRIEVTARFHLQGGTFVDGTETFYGGLQKGQLKDGLIIPSIYGANKRWNAVTLSVGNLKCKGCGRHAARSITESRNLTPGATDDPTELNYIWDEFLARGREAAQQ